MNSFTSSGIEVCTRSHCGCLAAIGTLRVGHGVTCPIEDCTLTPFISDDQIRKKGCFPLLVFARCRLAARCGLAAVCGLAARCSLLAARCMLAVRCLLLCSPPAAFCLRPAAPHLLLAAAACCCCSLLLLAAHLEHLLLLFCLSLDFVPFESSIVRCEKLRGQEKKAGNSAVAVGLALHHRAAAAPIYINKAPKISCPFNSATMEFAVAWLLHLRCMAVHGSAAHAIPRQRQSAMRGRECRDCAVLVALVMAVVCPLPLSPCIPPLA